VRTKTYSPDVLQARDFAAERRLLARFFKGKYRSSRAPALRKSASRADGSHGRLLKKPASGVLSRSASTRIRSGASSSPPNKPERREFVAVRAKASGKVLFSSHIGPPRSVNLRLRVPYVMSCVPQSRQNVFLWRRCVA